jgi:hypothetical protein
VEDKPQRVRRVMPFHPVLFAAYPLLALYRANQSTFPINQIWRPLGGAVLAALAAWAVFGVITRNIRKAAIAASIVTLAFFSYGHLYNLVLPVFRAALLPTMLVATILLLFLVLRSKRPLMDATSVLNFASVVLIAPTVWAVGTGLWNPAESDMSASSGKNGVLNLARYLQSEPPAVVVRPPLPQGERPDIYYIIVDAYGRADSLRTFYDYDNSDFLKALESRGFYIPKRSSSNYDQTTLCLASALNMNYLQEPTDLSNAREDLHAPIPQRRMIDENRVVDHLRKYGYKFVSIWAGIEETRILTADVVLNDDTKRSTFENESMGLTALESTPEAQRGRYDEHRGKILGAFTCLEGVARRESPKFVLTHILAPHPPFVLGSDGEALYPKGPMGLADASWLMKTLTPAEYRKGYIGQLQYVNRRVLGAIDRILRLSKKRPIIILQGDHGSRMTLDWESLEKTDVRETFSIMNAYFVPDQVRKDLYDTITPVNTFRIILTNLFGAAMAQLPDKTYYSRASKPFDFIDITTQVQANNAALK